MTAEQWIETIAGAQAPPFSFRLDGRDSADLLTGWERDGATMTDPDTGLQIRPVPAAQSSSAASLSG